MTLERYSHVMHMTSQVSGELRPGQGPVDVLRATFPAGTVSGAPEGAGHGDHRRPRAGQAGPVRRGRRLCRLLRATSTPPSPSAPWSSTPPAARSVSAGAGIVADSDPVRRGPRVPQQGPGDPGLGRRRPEPAGPPAADGGLVKRSPPNPLTVAYERGPSTSVWRSPPTTATRPAEERAFTDGAALVDRCARGRCSSTGRTPCNFLQSLLSQDIDRAGATGRGPTPSSCSPRASSTPTCACCGSATTAWLDCEVGRAEGLVASLRRFKIRIKAEVDRPDRRVGLPDTARSRRGRPARGRRRPAPAGRAPRPCPLGADGEARLVRADWPGGPPGADVVGPVAELTGVWAALVGAGFDPAGPDGLRGGPGAGRRSPPGARHRREDDPAGGVPRARRRVVHQGVLPRAGTGVPDRLPGATSTASCGALEIGDGGIDTTPPAGAGIVVGDKEVGALTTVARSERRRGGAGLRPARGRRARRRRRPMGRGRGYRPWLPPFRSGHEPQSQGPGGRRSWSAWSPWRCRSWSAAPRTTGRPCRPRRPETTTTSTEPIDLTQRLAGADRRPGRRPPPPGPSAVARRRIFGRVIDADGKPGPRGVRAGRPTTATRASPR